MQADAAPAAYRLLKLDAPSAAPSSPSSRKSRTQPRGQALHSELAETFTETLTETFAKLKLRLRNELRTRGIDEQVLFGAKDKDHLLRIARQHGIDDLPTSASSPPPAAMPHTSRPMAARPLSQRALSRRSQSSLESLSERQEIREAAARDKAEISQLNHTIR